MGFISKARVYAWVRYANWTNISKLGKNRLLGTSYIWLVVVPILAKFLSMVESPLDFSQYSPGFKLDLALPFSWKMFYFSAICIAIASTIYSFYCPEIIKSFRTFHDFEIEGRGVEYLKKYHLNIVRRDGVHLSDNATLRNLSEKNVQQKMFWIFRDYEDLRFPALRITCFSFYLIGILLVLIVLFNNFKYVFLRLKLF